jgi:hypothetical protein
MHPLHSRHPHRRTARGAAIKWKRSCANVMQCTTRHICYTQVRFAALECLPAPAFLQRSGQELADTTRPLWASRAGIHVLPQPPIQRRRQWLRPGKNCCWLAALTTWDLERRQQRDTAAELCAAFSSWSPNCFSRWSAASGTARNKINRNRRRNTPPPLPRSSSSS